jgi:hypothetical protein
VAHENQVTIKRGGACGRSNCAELLAQTEAAEKNILQTSKTSTGFASIWHHGLEGCGARMPSVRQEGSIEDRMMRRIMKSTLQEYILLDTLIVFSLAVTAV